MILAEEWKSANSFRNPYTDRFTEMAEALEGQGKKKVLFNPTTAGRMEAGEY